MTSTIAHTPAIVSCRKCHCTVFRAKISIAETYLLLACITCSEPILFAVTELVTDLHDNPKSRTIEA
jgi:hypothetical protein